jgi:hypothetical protein
VDEETAERETTLGMVAWLMCDQNVKSAPARTEAYVVETVSNLVGWNKILGVGKMLGRHKIIIKGHMVTWGSRRN